jgi:DNA-binding SARP family transcriptional activator
MAGFMTSIEKGSVRVRLLGGFEVWCADVPVRGFESQKVRALFAYLLCQSDRAFSRDHLAGLLWPERDPEGARHALRQALYNLKTALPGTEPVLTSQAGLQINPAACLWVDVTAFEEAVQRGTGRNAVDPSQLAAAAQLYRGELLAGFFVKDSEAFEEWLVGEQERLREAAVDVLRALVETYRRRGEYRFGLHYARRLAALEPLSEEACRELMSLSLLAGQRSRALAEYEKLQALLKKELGVEPLPETRALYGSILREGPGEVEVEADAEPVGPLIPLVGRGQAFASLSADWEQVRRGDRRITLVTGEPGCGKTRLIRSFLDAATSQRRSLVLQGSGDGLETAAPCQAITEALTGALPDESGAAEEALALPPPADRRRFFDAVTSCLEALCLPGEGGPTPLILFLDDLHRSDPETPELLRHAADRLAGLPVWIVAVSQGGEEDVLRRALLDPSTGDWLGLPGEATGCSQSPKERAGQTEPVPVTEIGLGRLPAAALREIAGSLVAEDEAAELGRFLAERTSGLPLEVAEVINFLWDDGLLVPAEKAGWRLSGPLAGLELPGDGTIQDLILHRIGRLPSSARRLATLAAVAGPSFDFALLENAGEEHAVVIEIGLELMLRRWLLRQSLGRWESGQRRRDITLWAEGMRRGRFEFANRHIRSALVTAVDPRRRQVLHAQIAAALEALPGGGGPASRALAHHWAAAGEPAKAEAAWTAAQTHLSPPG